MKITLVALNAHYMHTNLAVRQMLPALSGFGVQFYEGHINLPCRRLLQDIARGEPDVIGFSCYIWNIALVTRLCRALRLALPDVRLVLGGPEVAYRAPDLLRELPEADYVLQGEGESALPMLLRSIEAERGGGEMPLRDVPGLCWRADGEVLCNAKPEPLPPRDWPDPYANGIAGLERRILYIETSRGCPFSCQFCLSSAEQGVRALDADEAVRRLTALADAGAALIKLVDRTFNFDPRRADYIWSALIEHAAHTGYSGTYHFEIGAQLIDDAALQVLGRAPKGLFQFEVGLQSSDSGVLAKVGRKVDFERVADAVSALRALDTIHLHVDLIAGMPGDDMPRFARSFDDAYSLGAEQLQLGFLKLLHGSGLRRDAGVLGIIFEKDAPYEVISTREMRFAELCHLKDVEQTLNWYHNSGLYRCTLRWLLGERGPFGLFSSLAHAFRASGVFDVERANKARAEALLAWADSPQLRALMRHDLLRAGRRRDLPDALAFLEGEAERSLLRARYHPVRGQSAFVYEWDVLAFERGGPLSPGGTLVIYGA